MWCPSILSQLFIEFVFNLQIDSSGFEEMPLDIFQRMLKWAELDTHAAAREHSDINALEI